MRLPCGSSAYCLVLVVAAMRVAVSQTPARNEDTQPRFDVVSIKRSAAAVNSAARDRPDGGFTRTNWYTSTLIAEAHPPTYRSDIVGLPEWAKKEGYDIKATSTLSRATRDDRVSMLRAMLAERFKFSAHFEKRERDAFELVVSRRDGSLGPGLKPIDIDCVQMREERAAAEAATFSPPGGLPDLSKPPPPCAFRMGAASHRNKGANMDDYLLEGSGTIDDLARFLRGTTGVTGGREIVNRTKLSRSYAVTMTFDRKSVFSLQPNAAPASDTGPDMRSALQDQLGLKLQSSRVALDTLIVDHLERPTED
jgi:uncharacterized protein (TIGR03435 family)